MEKFREETYIPKNQRKKIILLSDDLRMPSGVGTMSKEIIMQTCQTFNWFQVGAAINHPEAGKLIDLSSEVAKETGVDDASVRLLPYNGYGDEMLIRQLLIYEKPDAILHYTDPRFWIWLYQMEHEVRQQVPLLFYHVWDNLPYPMYNKPYYESCDWFGCISKQTLNIVRNVWKEVDASMLDYIPHGIDSKKFFPITEDMKEEYARMNNIKSVIFKDLGEEPKFVIFYNNRNIRRKQTSNIILAFSKFVDDLPENLKNKVVLLLHTQPVDPNGTDLPVVADVLAPGKVVMFSPNRIDYKELNCLYNIADVTINMSNAEGFGLSTAESIMAGTPIIATVTGGLQDQMRFLENGKPIEFNSEWSSNSDGRVKGTNGEWAFPLFPRTRSITGSPMTPYIFDDYSDWEDAAKVLREVYELGREERKRRGKLGREWMLTEESGMEAREMGKRFIRGINKAINSWKPRERFNIYKI